MANVLWTQILGAMHLARIRVGVRQAAPGIPELFTVAPEQLARHLRGQRAGDRRRPAVKLGRRGAAAAFGRRHPLRRAPAGGRVAARADGGRRRRALRRQVPRRRAGARRARGRGRRRRAGAAAGAAGARAGDRSALPAELARAEPDPEIQDLLYASAGINLGVDFLPGALPFTPAAVAEIDPELAADVVWLDALTTNVDRTPRNPNLLVWHGRTWLIDHGAALFRQHGARPLAEHRARAVPADRRPRAARRGGAAARGRRAPGGRAAQAALDDRRGARARGVARRRSRRAPRAISPAS